MSALQTSIFAFLILQAASSLAATSTKTFHCAVENIEITNFDLLSMPAGTQQEIRMLHLNCDQETHSPGAHSAFVLAPIQYQPQLEALKASQNKADFEVTLSGYAGVLVAINGQAVGPVQPNQREGFSIQLLEQTRFVSSSRVKEIFEQNCQGCGHQVEFLGIDSALRVRLSTSRSPGTANGDGRGTLGDLRLIVQLAAHLPATAQPGDDLALSPRDSTAIATFLMFNKFPDSLNIAEGSVTCFSQQQCFVLHH